MHFESWSKCEHVAYGTTHTHTHTHMKKTHTKEQTTIVSIHSSLYFCLPSPLPLLCLPQLDSPVILSPQLLMFLLVYVIIYKLTLWNMNSWQQTTCSRRHLYTNINEGVVGVTRHAVMKRNWNNKPKQTNQHIHHKIKLFPKI